MKKVYTVIKTACFPKQWKVIPVGEPYADNSWNNYFLTREEARKEANKRNENNQH